MSNQIERKPLLLAFLTGLCGNATVAALTSSYVPFSVFPIIAFVLALIMLWQAYIEIGRASCRERVYAPV